VSLISRIKYLTGLSKTPLDLTELNVIQEEIDSVKNECVDNINMKLQPGGVIYTSNTGPSQLPLTGSTVRWTKLVNEITPPTKEQTEQASLINTKKFKLIAEEFCKRNPVWTIVPDINEPLRRIRIMHSSNQLWIQDCFPMNEIKVVGGSIKLESQLGQQFPVHPMLQFEKWAFGMEDCPYGN
jgi:hypothetical protein